MKHPKFPRINWVINDNLSLITDNKLKHNYQQFGAVCSLVEEKYLPKLTHNKYITEKRTTRI
jgi:hypothetical protein